MPVPAWVWALAAVAGLGLASWAYTSWHTRRARRRLGPRGIFRTVDGVEVHHLRYGEGPLVLFLHGLAGFLQDFTENGILDALSQDREVLVLDRPGYGHSTLPKPELSDPRAQADWLARLIEATGHEDAVVVGHSLGGALALSLAVRHPERVRGLVLLAPYAYPNTEPDDWIHKLPRLPWLRTGIAWTLVVPVARLLEPWFVSASFTPQPVPDSYHQLWLDHVLQPDHFRTTIEELRRIDPALAELRAGYPDVDVPTVILAGMQDVSVDPVENAHRLADELPSAELVTFGGYGHMIPWTHPDEVVEAVRRVDEQAGGQARSEA